MTLGELSASTPVVVAAVVLLLTVVGILARWLAVSLWRALRAGLTRQGERIGDLETDVTELRAEARLEAVRRWQLEAALLRVGLDLPRWPDSPDITPDDLEADTSVSRSMPPLPEFPRHRR